jgi:glycosyltransferase involved in cell wall biosynthesis
VDEIVSRHRLAGTVTFAGMLTGDMKLAALSAARYFCLPSYSEALSVALLEALSIGLPAIITPSCNMDEVVSYGAGVVSSNEPDPLAETLSQCLSLSGVAWEAMSEGARRLARTQYDWAHVAEKMHSVYVWLLGGPKPDCVIN